jgi:predicted lipoprotein with Yx(FWY)xxD motif
MKRWLALLVVGLMLMPSLGVRAQTPEAGPTTVLVAESAELGKYFTDAHGRTLYLWTVDTSANSSNCYGPCVEFWPLFTADEPLTLPDGVDGELALMDRTDGTTQVTYNGIPLYYFAADTKPGDVNGQWVGDAWFVVAPGEQFGAAAAMVQQTLATPVDGGNTLLIAHDDTLGDYFTDADGRTVYLFTKDSAIYTSACTGDCLANWPPVPSTAGGRLSLPDGGLGELATMNGNDGNPQLAYNGIPLYYFAGDTEAGQTNGQGVGGVWWVVKPGAQLGQATPTAG